MSDLETVLAFTIALLIAWPLILCVGRLTTIANALRRIAGTQDRRLMLELGREQEIAELRASLDAEPYRDDTDD